MAIWQGRALRKISGGRIRMAREKRRYELGREPVYTHIGDRRIKIIRVRGGNKKVKLLRDTYVNVYNPATKKTERAKVSTVIENPANPHFAQRNIITKGAIVETSLGKVKITSRPGQHGQLNGVLIE
ncbi:MAG: 30S ribosomal protein S8e [Euryarchaeota archaeon]|nr:30S ribosomal protein S8e [Euryarchaeota archaeon]